jgi:hypothetical protein
LQSSCLRRLSSWDYILYPLPPELGFELRALHLPRRWSTTRATPSSLFTLAIFQVFRILLGASLDLNPSTFAFLVAGITGVHHNTLLFCLDRLFLTFLLWLAWNYNPPNLLNSRDYRCEPLKQAFHWSFLGLLKYLIKLKYLRG